MASCPVLHRRVQAITDPTERAVFAMSNDRDGNVVVAYDRHVDGSLDEVGRFDTGGTGSGSFEDTANGLVLATADGETPGATASLSSA